MSYGTYFMHRGPDSGGAAPSTMPGCRAPIGSKGKQQIGAYSLENGLSKLQPLYSSFTRLTIDCGTFHEWLMPIGEYTPPLHTAKCEPSARLPQGIVGGMLEDDLGPLMAYSLPSGVLRGIPSRSSRFVYKATCERCANKQGGPGLKLSP